VYGAYGSVRLVVAVRCQFVVVEAFSLTSFRAGLRLCVLPQSWPRRTSNPFQNSCLFAHIKGTTVLQLLDKLKFLSVPPGRFPVRVLKPFKILPRSPEETHLSESRKKKGDAFVCAISLDISDRTMETSNTASASGVAGATSAGDGGKGTFNTFVTQSGAGLFAYEPQFPKCSPTSSSPSSSPPPHTLQESTGVAAAAGCVLGDSRPHSSTPTLDSTEGASSPTRAGKEVVAQTLTHIQKQEDEGFSHSVSPSEEAQQPADKSTGKSSCGGCTTSIPGEVSDNVVVPVAEKLVQQQTLDSMAHPPGAVGPNAAILNNLLGDKYRQNPPGSLVSGPSSTTDLDASLAVATLGMGGLGIRQEEAHMVNAEAFMMAQQQQQHQQQHSFMQTFHRPQGPPRVSVDGMGTGLPASLFNQNAGLLAAQQVFRLNNDPLTRSPLRISSAVLCATSDLAFPPCARPQVQPNPTLVQQQTLAQNVYSKYGIVTNGGYPSPLKTPGAPIKTTDSDKGPEGCNLFVFHIPNDMTNLDLYQVRILTCFSGYEMLSYNHGKPNFDVTVLPPLSPSADVLHVRTSHLRAHHGGQGNGSLPGLWFRQLQQP